MHNPADYIKIALIAFAGIWVINKTLTKLGAAQFKA